jgi:hypothetical protein
MLRFAPLLLLLTAVPASGMDMASVDAIINSCQKGQICSCPRAKIARIDKSACGPEPQWILDDPNSLGIDDHGNAKKFDKYSKCMDDLFNANIKIDRYNSIFESCQHPGASDGKTRFTNLPARPSYSGDGKTLNEQVQDVKAAEAERQAEEARAYAAAHPPAVTQPPGVQPTQAPSPQNTENIYQYCKAEMMKIWPRGEFCYDGFPQNCGIAGYRECVRGDPNWRKSVHYQ